MRLIVTILWLLATLCWLPWLFLLGRLIVDLASGTHWSQSYYVDYVIGGVWPTYGILAPWSIVSVWPLGALAGMALSAAGWRIYWREQDCILTRPAWLVGLSIAIPAIAPLIMLADARRRHLNQNVELDRHILDAQQRIKSK